MKMDMNTRGITAALLAPFFIAVDVICVNMTGGHIPPLVTSALGGLVGAPILFIYHLLRRTDLQFGKILTQLRVPLIKVLLSRSLIGSALIVAGFTMTTAVKAVLLLRLEPLFVLCWSVAGGKEKFTVTKLSLLAIILGGTALVVSPHGTISDINLGDVLIVLSLVLLSYSFGPTEEIVSQSSSAGLNILSTSVGALVILVLVLFLYGPGCLMLTPAEWQTIWGFAVSFYVFACSLYLFAFKTVKPWIIASLMSLEVVFGLLLAFVVLRESIAPVQAIGAAIVCGATYFIAREKAERQATPVPAVD